MSVWEIGDNPFRLPWRVYEDEFHTPPSQPTPVLESGSSINYSDHNFGDKYLIKVNVPGFTEDDIKVSISEYMNKYQISITGYISRKDKYGILTKNSINITRIVSNVDPETLEANLENGVLFVVIKTIPKKEKYTKTVKVIKCRSRDNS